MRIKEIMTPTVISIRSDQSLLEVRELMLSNNLRRIPVTDKEGLLMGIVTDGDVSRLRRAMQVCWTVMRPITCWENLRSAIS